MSDIVVMKFGGTSVRDAAARAAARAHVQRWVKAGARVAVVVSAMGRAGEPYATDTLIGLMTAAGEDVDPHELDLAMSVGEIISAARFAHELTTDGIPARAFTGAQAGFLTSDDPGCAEILRVEPTLLHRCFEQGKVGVVAGFQGGDESGVTRTLGRGGSDTSAVALGAAFGVQVVEIYTDVDGIATADPRRVSAARFLKRIGARSLLAMADEGSKVVHPRAVRAALPGRIALRIRNTFTDDPGTLVHHEPETGPARAVALAHRQEMLLLKVPAGRPWEMVPELLKLGGDRYLLPDDVYCEERLDRLREDCGALDTERGWATASLILAGDPPGGFAAPDLGTDCEPLVAPEGVLRWLLRQDALDATLARLHARFIDTAP